MPTRSIRDFNDFDVWRAARVLRKAFYKLVKGLADAKSLDTEAQRVTRLINGYLRTTMARKATNHEGTREHPIFEFPFSIFGLPVSSF